MAPSDDLDVRLVTPDDRKAVLAVLEAALGWVPDDAYARFFDWKHEANPFGRSPGWVACDGDRIVGVRVFLRWVFERDGAPVRAVRAVDTATDPAYQGRGIFRTLTLRALDELAADGVSFVFNTPNEQSRPGYLKMGWHVVGRPRIAVRPRLGPASLRRLVAARVPAEKWSTPTAAGVDAAEALADEGALAQLLASQPPAAPGRLRTARSPEWYRWRFGFPELAYRVFPVGRDLAEGFAVARLRGRGAATEAAVVEVLVPGGDGAVAARALRAVAARSGADYALVLGGVPWRAGFVPLPTQGPTLTWRRVTDEGDPPPLAAWDLSLADVELF